MMLYFIVMMRHLLGNMIIKYITIPEFDKDFKTLTKRLKTLPNDFEIFKQFVLELYYEQNIPTKAFIPMEGFCGTKYISNKVKKFACKSLKGKGCDSGIRIIFIWDKENKTITFIEIYFKADQKNENKERLEKFLKERYDK